MAGVIPIIFAAAIMAFPPTIAQFFPGSQSFINDHFTPSSLAYILLQSVLIVVFTYFYTAVQFNPVDQADNYPTRDLHPRHPAGAPDSDSTWIACSRG